MCFSQCKINTGYHNIRKCKAAAHNSEISSKRVYIKEMSNTPCFLKSFALPNTCLKWFVERFENFDRNDKGCAFYNQEPCFRKRTWNACYKPLSQLVHFLKVSLNPSDIHVCVINQLPGVICLSDHLTNKQGDGHNGPGFQFSLHDSTVNPCLFVVNLNRINCNGEKFI